MCAAVFPQFVDKRLNDGWAGKAKESAFDTEPMNSKVLEGMCYTYRNLASRTVLRPLLGRTSENEMQELRIVVEWEYIRVYPVDGS